MNFGHKQRLNVFVKNRFILHLCLKGKGYYNLGEDMPVYLL